MLNNESVTMSDDNVLHAHRFEYAAIAMRVDESSRLDNRHPSIRLA
jgi:hypothetical protein